MCICSSSARHIFVANGHNVFKLTPIPYELQVQQLVLQQHYELAMQICVSVVLARVVCNGSEDRTGG